VTRTATPNTIAGLAARLTDRRDRETYAALVSYVNELPPGDEFRQLMEMLGLLSLLGQRVPDALAEFLAELRGQTAATADYHAKVDARLASLPSEIAAGVDPAAVAQAMSESFRQQLGTTGLRDTAALLGDVAAALKPAAGEYRRIASTISAETAKLLTTARQVHEHNARLIVQHRSHRWALQAVGALLLFLVGGLCGIVLEKRQTVDVLRDLALQVERAERPAAVPIVEVPRKKKSGS